MTKQEFMDSLQWIVGSVPKDHWRTHPEIAMACEMADGSTFIVGHQNFNDGICGCCAGESLNKVVRYAMLWDE
jgi:hypothetical protein